MYETSERPSEPDIAHARSLRHPGNVPMVVQKVVEIPDGASCFVFDPCCKVEFLGKFIWLGTP